MKLLITRCSPRSLGSWILSSREDCMRALRGHVLRGFSSFAGRELVEGSSLEVPHAISTEDASSATISRKTAGWCRTFSLQASSLLTRPGTREINVSGADWSSAGVTNKFSAAAKLNSGTSGWLRTRGPWTRGSHVIGRCNREASSDRSAGAASSLDATSTLASSRPSQELYDASEDIDSAAAFGIGRKLVLRQEPVGLFGYEVLKTADGFQRFANEAIAKSEDLIERIRLHPPSLETIRMLDDVSDTVCSIMDAAELCRNTHADREYVKEANEAFLRVSEYVQKLNMNQSLYTALVAAMDGGATADSDEAHRVAVTLRQDFERGGVHLPEEKREMVQQLNSEITNLGMRFGQNVASDRSYVDVYPASSLQSLPASIHAMLKRVRQGQETLDPLGQGPFSGGSTKAWPLVGKEGMRVPVDPLVVRSVLKWVADPEVRRQVYQAGYSSPAENLDVLDDLIDARHELAQLLGFPSYAEFTVAPLMAKSPKTITAFLEELSTCMKAKAEEDMEVLRLHKRAKEGTRDAEIHAWDRAYYMGLAKSKAHNLTSAGTAAYFPLHRCLEGLGLLMRSMFSVELRDSPMAPGEAWAADVFKLALTHPDEGELGHIYLDLYPRPGKYTHNAHFTVRCGRRTSEGGYQLPLVALVCNFARPLASSPSLLSHAEVETLFHEFGHALHSLLARTEYQHLSGTRAPLDFVETPSNLLEYFAWDHRLLRRFARHHSTGEPIPEKLLASLTLSKSMFAASEMQMQVTYALMDQEFFGHQPMSRGSTTEVLAELQERHMGVQHVPGTHWQSRFTHLVGYGGGYYSYLYAKCFASQLWAAHFEADPLSRSAGEVLWKGLLQSGGERDPALMLRNILGESGVLATPGGGIKPCAAQLLREIGQ